MQEISFVIKIKVRQTLLRQSDFESAQVDFTPLSLRDVKLQKSDILWSDIGGEDNCVSHGLSLIRCFCFVEVYMRPVVCSEKLSSGPPSMVPSLPVARCVYGLGMQLISKMNCELIFACM